tara:strand:+ start:853 stop:1146 length:294 start_codon:yes stop_codon:yes gene_type:complete
MKETPDFYRIASEFYLSASLPQDYLEMDDDDFNAFLEENAWQPFEVLPSTFMSATFSSWSGEDISENIQSLSYRMENIARETRKNTLDEVRAALNIN